MAHRVRFGIFDFDPDQRELRRNGLPVRLQSQPAQVLSVLVEHAGELVTRDQLRQAVWGTETFVDFDRGLNYCIAQIRAALGDSAESPRFVRTIPKQGYQFVAPVGPVAAVEIPAVAVLSSQSRRGPTRAYALLAGTTLAVCAVVLLLAVERRPVNIAIARFDNETGNAEMDRFADGLSDSVVAAMTTAGGGRYGIIGNATLLRQPRAKRDLSAIASSLHAGYVVLGQVQRNATHTRVLAHLIRLPQQTHLGVARFDRDVNDPLASENELGELIAAEFLRRLNASPSSRGR